MKKAGIILSVLGVGLLTAGIIYLVKKKKEEKKSGFIDTDWQSNFSPEDSIIYSNPLNKSGLRQAAVSFRVNNNQLRNELLYERAIKSTTNPYKPKEKTSNACGCGT